MADRKLPSFSFDVSAGTRGGGAIVGRSRTLPGFAPKADPSRKITPAVRRAWPSPVPASFVPWEPDLPEPYRIPEGSTVELAGSYTLPSKGELALSVILNIIGDTWWLGCSDLHSLFVKTQSALRRHFQRSLLLKCMDNLSVKWPQYKWDEFHDCVGMTVGPPFINAIPQLCGLAGCPNCGQDSLDDAICVLKKMEESTKLFEPLSETCPNFIAPLFANSSVSGPDCVKYLQWEGAWQSSSTTTFQFDSGVVTTLGTTKDGNPSAPPGTPARLVWEMRMLLAVSSLKKCPWVAQVVQSGTHQPFTKLDLTTGFAGTGGAVPCKWGASQFSNGDFSKFQLLVDVFC